MVGRVESGGSAVFESPGTRPLASALVEVVQGWADAQYRLVVLAAEFADSSEWMLESPTAAHWLAAAADVEPCTAREWIRIGHQLAVWFKDHTDAADLEAHQHALRSVKWRTEADGMVVFTLRLPPLLAGILIATLTRMVMRTTARRAADGSWPSTSQHYADAFEEILAEGAGEVTTEVVVHLRGDGATLDDGTPIADTVVERIAPTSFLRAMIHDAESKPVDVSNRRRHPTTRQKRFVKERDRTCRDCGSRELLVYDHNPAHEETGHTLTGELDLRCAPCHHRRHRRGEPR